MADVELSAPRVVLDADGWTDARVLARLHGQPVAEIDLDLGDGPVTTRDVEQRVLDRGDGVLEDHLRRDGIDRPGQEPPAGAARHRCLEALLPTTPRPAVSVVIPTRNRAGLLATCLDSVLAVRYPDLEVLVVDNAPADDSTRATVHERFGNDARVRYVRLDRAGASHARNVGARLARGEIVAFTDDDALVDELWVAALVAGFADDPSIVCVTGLTLAGSLETPAAQAFEAYGGMGLGLRPRLYDRDEHRGDTLLYPYTAGVFGASNNVAFRREDFLARGGFDVTIGPGTAVFGAEDLDLFLAVVLSGDRIAYEPAATVRHEHRADFADLYWQVFTYSAGFTALLTKWALADRRVAVDLARRVPRILPAALLASHRGGSEAGVGQYPAQLRWLERAGYLYGPLAYLRSRVDLLRGRTAGSAQAGSAVEPVPVLRDPAAAGGLPGALSGDLR
ncbi:hypothetical protein GCM10022262_05620 [Georgenia daeguensis]|uniref:Glycosyltransferase 2-like domain-containing protein n=1 Tax=Georgenia daeguensis TaxID=908355 RepID=A0ABP8EQC4_9MICO